MTRCLSYTTACDKDERRDEIAPGSSMEMSGSAKTSPEYLSIYLLGVVVCHGHSG